MFVKEDVRKLGTVETIAAIRDIDGADLIEVATVRGWNVVVGKGEFEVGDTAAFFEIDSALPVDLPEFAFLAERGVKVDQETGREYHVLKTVRLRGQYSQGLLIPAWREEIFDEVLKWEPDPPKQPSATSGARTDIVGPFLVNYVQKTDSERIQNLSTETWEALRLMGGWVATEKIDGTSCTVVRSLDGDMRVCSRNWEVGDGDNIYWRTLRENGFEIEMLELGDVLQMELAGPGIQGNPLGLDRVRPFVFSCFDSYGTHWSRPAWPEWAYDLATPQLWVGLPNTVEEAIAQVDGLKSSVSPGRLAEGVVYHTPHNPRALQGRHTFKVISNKYLLKEKK